MTALQESYRPADQSGEVLDTTVGQVLVDAVAEVPDTVALVEGVAASDRRRWTYRQLLQEATGVARGLMATTQPGERVAIWAGNSPEWVFVELGAALAGVTLVTVNPALTATEAEYVFRQSRCGVIIHDDEFRGASLRESSPDWRPNCPSCGRRSASPPSIS